MNTPRVLRDQRADDFAGVEFAPCLAAWPTESTVGQLIWRFSSELDATVQFYTRFRAEGKVLPKALVGWSYKSRAADRMRVYCRTIEPPDGGQLVLFVCVAQYDQYITTLQAPFGVGGLGLPDLEHLLQAVDDRMIQALHEPAGK